MKCLIIEDNPQVQELLTGLLSDAYKDIDILPPSASVAQATRVIKKEVPDLMLLDIELKDGTVFELFEDLSARVFDNTAMIFITAYGSFENIHRALRLAAIDFLTKPVDPEEFYRAIDKAREQLIQKQTRSKLDHLLNILEAPDKLTQTDRVPFFLPKGVIRYEEKHNILYVEGEDNISHVYLNSGENFTSTRHLGFYKHYLLQSEPFFQTSKQHIVNLEHVTRFDPRENCLYLKQDKHLYVSRRKSKELSDFFRSYFDRSS